VPYRSYLKIARMQAMYQPLFHATFYRDRGVVELPKPGDEFITILLQEIPFGFEVSITQGAFQREQKTKEKQYTYPTLERAKEACRKACSSIESAGLKQADPSMSA
jgi:hypothetical protein